MDPLSDFIDKAGVSGAFFARARGRAPWAVATRGASEAIFHVAIEGSGIVRLADAGFAEAANELTWQRGDVIVLPHGHSHVMASAAGVPAVAIRSLTPEIGADGLPCVECGGGAGAGAGAGAGERAPGGAASILCGTFGLEPEAAEHLLPHLPPVLIARGDGSSLATWIDATVQLLSDERTMGQPGSRTVLQRLADVLFIHVLRTWIAKRQEVAPGWLNGLADPGVARALQAIHDEPEAEWTAAGLARVAGMSRSGFYSRFVAVVGETPGDYLAKWRMLLARRRLRAGDDAIASVAAQVGYASEAAFSRAFKRRVGTSPAAWRAAQRSGERAEGGSMQPLRAAAVEG